MGHLHVELWGAWYPSSGRLRRFGHSPALLLALGVFGLRASVVTAAKASSGALDSPRLVRSESSTSAARHTSLAATGEGNAEDKEDENDDEEKNEHGGAGSAGDALRLGLQSGEHCLRYKENGEPLYVESVPGSTRCLAGVPIYNFHWAFPGGVSLAEAVENKSFMVIFPNSYTDSDMENLCKDAEKQVGVDCLDVGHPSEGGNPQIVLVATLPALQEFLSKHPAAVFVEPDKEFENEKDKGGADKEFGMPPGGSLVSCYAQKAIDFMKGLPAPASWGIDRIDNPHAKMDCRSPETNGKIGGKRAYVWVLDTGVNINHDDFEGRAVPGIDFTMGGRRRKVKVCKKSDKESKCSVDVAGHGSHCAGTIGGRNYGIAREVTLMSAKVLRDDMGGNMLWLPEALDYIVKWHFEHSKPPTVISMSLAAPGTSAALENAVNRAISAGLVVVAAAGNAAEDACQHTPANIKSVITVGATTVSDEFASYSNFGPCVDILAPGSDIVSAGPGGTAAEKVDSGTSMACPHVSAAAALLLSENESIQGSTAQRIVLQYLKDKAVQGAISSIKGETPNLLLDVHELLAPVDQWKERVAFIAALFVILLGPPLASVVMRFMANRKKQADQPSEPAVSEWPAPAHEGAAGPADPGAAAGKS